MGVQVSLPAPKEKNEDLVFIVDWMMNMVEPGMQGAA